MQSEKDSESLSGHDYSEWPIFSQCRRRPGKKSLKTNTKLPNDDDIILVSDDSDDCDETICSQAPSGDSVNIPPRDYSEWPIFASCKGRPGKKSLETNTKLPNDDDIVLVSDDSNETICSQPPIGDNFGDSVNMVISDDSDEAIHSQTPSGDNVGDSVNIMVISDDSEDAVCTGDEGSSRKKLQDSIMLDQSDDTPNLSQQADVPSTKMNIDNALEDLLDDEISQLFSQISEEETAIKKDLLTQLEKPIVKNISNAPLTDINPNNTLMADKDLFDDEYSGIFSQISEKETEEAGLIKDMSDKDLFDDEYSAIFSQISEEETAIKKDLVTQLENPIVKNISNAPLTDINPNNTLMSDEDLFDDKYSAIFSQISEKETEEAGLIKDMPDKDLFDDEYSAIFSQISEKETEEAGVIKDLSELLNKLTLPKSKCEKNNVEKELLINAVEFSLSSMKQNKCIEKKEILSYIDKNIKSTEYQLKIVKDMLKLVEVSSNASNTVKTYMNKVDENISTDKLTLGEIKQKIKECKGSSKFQGNKKFPAGNSHLKSDMFNEMKVSIKKLLSPENNDIDVDEDFFPAVTKLPNYTHLFKKRGYLTKVVRNRTPILFVINLLQAQNYVLSNTLICDNIYVIKEHILFSRAHIRGIITSVQRGSKFKYIIDDGTGCIPCLIDERDLPESSTTVPIIKFGSAKVAYESITDFMDIHLGDTLQITGRLNIYNKRRYFFICRICRENGQSNVRECIYIRYVNMCQKLYIKRWEKIK